MSAAVDAGADRHLAAVRSWPVSVKELSRAMASRSLPRVTEDAPAHYRRDASYPAGIAFLPTVMMALGFLVSWMFYIRRPYLPVELAVSTRCSTSSCSTNGISTSSMTSSSSARQSGSLLPLEEGRWLRHRRLWPDGVSARVLDVTRNVVKIQTGYLYHYAFAMLIGSQADHLVHVRLGVQ